MGKMKMVLVYFSEKDAFLSGLFQLESDTFPVLIGSACAY